MLYFRKGFRSFNTENLGSVGQRASKLPAVKVGGHKKKSADRPRPLSNQSARIRVVPGSNHSQSLMAGNFAALWPTDPKFSALKDLNPFKTVSKVQEASSILRVVFALSKWPHLHRAYLVTVRFHLILAVHSVDICSESKHMRKTPPNQLLNALLLGIFPFDTHFCDTWLTDCIIVNWYLHI